MYAADAQAADQSTSAKDLTYITEQLPPYNFEKDGKLQGISVDLLDAVWEKMGADLNRSAIKLLPWTEGYDMALNENNTVIFSTARLPQREQLFKWAGPIATGRDVLLTKSDRNISISGPEELKKYRIAAIKDDSAAQVLLDKGLKKEDLVLEATSTPIIEMLQNDSIDAWAYSDISGIWLINESGADTSDFKIAYTLGQIDLYYAFNKETPDSLVQSFQQAIDSINNNKDKDGVTDYEKILNKYVPAEYAINNTDESRLMAFLNEAAAYVKDNGKEKALQEFNNRSGSFVRGDLYIFAYDFNEINLAHPFMPSLVGQKGLLDINGMDVTRNELSLAKRGGGFMYLVFPNPTHEGKDELKLIYIKDVNDNLYLGSGLYLSDISASFDKEDRDELVAYVDSALKFAKENGKDKALAAFNDPKGNFTRDGRYIFAYDYEGRNLALPKQPELIGTNRIDVQDPNGVYFVKQAIDLARTGDGFHYYIYPDPSRNMTPALKLSYVVNVDGTWFLGSGIYADCDEETN
ncbi:MAG TPA: cache domain-containing protein [Methanotrichaceae archaeon]|nr:cache domain-containing protein [Methanotrichaceae archaeon]